MKEEDSESSSVPARPRFHWLRRDGIDLGDAVVQFFAVLLGVLLALLISEWTTQRQQQAAARAAMQQKQANVDEAMHAIRAELVANRAALHQSAAFLYDGIARMLDSPKNRNQPPRSCYLWDQWSGTGAVNVTDAAYQTAIATQALSHMPFNHAQQVAQTYGKQAVVHKSFDLIRSNILIAGPHPLGLCVSAVKSFIANEHHLDAAYSALIGPDKTEWPTPPPKSSLPANTTK